MEVSIECDVQDGSYCALASSIACNMSAQASRICSEEIVNGGAMRKLLGCDKNQ
jgi:hypothetical protein